MFRRWYVCGIKISGVRTMTSGTVFGMTFGSLMDVMRISGDLSCRIQKLDPVGPRLDLEFLRQVYSPRGHYSSSIKSCEMWDKLNFIHFYCPNNALARVARVIWTRPVMTCQQIKWTSTEIIWTVEWCELRRPINWIVKRQSKRVEPLVSI